MNSVPGAPHPPAGTILYVEDSPFNQLLMRDVMRKRPGVHLVVTGTGAGALEAAMAEPPALILLDRNLPDMTGDEILRALRSRPETQTTPVIIVSGDTARPRNSDGRDRLPHQALRHPRNAQVHRPDARSRPSATRKELTFPTANVLTLILLR